MTTRQFLSLTWGWHPVVIALCAVAVGGYAWRERLRFSGRSLFLMAAVAALLLALASPLATLADGYLFSAHMLQHLLLQLVVPPLVLLSLPDGGRPKSEGRSPKSDGGASQLEGLALSKAGDDGSAASASVGSGKSLRSRVFGLRDSAFGLRPSDFLANLLSPILSRPLITWFLGLGAMWIWHVPTLCSASATNPWVHLLQGISLLLMGTAFWWPIIGPWRSQWLSPLVGVLYLFSACVGCTILGIILTFAPLGVCPVFMHPADYLGIMPLLRDGWGLTPARDQQLGGLLMWVPPCFVYLSGIFGLFARWYASPDPELSAGTETGAPTDPPEFAHGHPIKEKA